MSLLKASRIAVLLLSSLFVGFAGSATAQFSGDYVMSPSAPIDIPLDERAVRAAGIGYTAPERVRGSGDLMFPGTVVVPPAQLRVVAAPVDGLIETIEVAPDELVEAGQTILRMRSPELIAAQREFISADADAILARDRLRRSETLFAAKALPERDLRTIENEAKTTTYLADERLHALRLMGMTEEDIRALRDTREYRANVAIVAPAAGYVLSRYSSPGARVAAAEPLFTIAQLDPLWVNIQVPASRLGSIAVGATVNLPAYGARGRIIRIGRSVDPATQSVIAVAEVNADLSSVRPGLAVTASVRVERGSVPDWVVPASAVVRHRERSWIFVKTAQGVRAQPVDVLSENARDASIRANLEPGDQVASRGLIALLAELAKRDSE